MPAAAQAAPPAAPTTDVPRHVADLSDIQRCADSKKDDVMDRTSVNTQSWIAFRFQFYMALPYHSLQHLDTTQHAQPVH